jgi:hypothetical protein
MTRDQQIDAIRAACIKANPELTVRQNEVDVLWDRLSEISGNDLWNRLSKQEWEFARDVLFERPICLADVLLAIEPIRTRRGLLNAPAESVVKSWNLRHDDLTKQSDETISWLCDLLAK